MNTRVDIHPGFYHMQLGIMLSKYRWAFCIDVEVGKWGIQPR
jgi:hypothetical protein